MEKNNQPLILGIVVIGAVLIIALALIFTRGSDETTTETAGESNTAENREDTDAEENGEAGQEETDGEGAEFEVVAANFVPGDGQIIASLDILNRNEESLSIRCSYTVGYKESTAGAWAGDNETYTLQPGQNEFSDSILSQPTGGPSGLTGADLVDEFENLNISVDCERSDDWQPAPTPGPDVLPSNWNSLTPQQKTDLNPFGCDHDTQWVSSENGTCIDKPARSPLRYVGYLFGDSPIYSQGNRLDGICRGSDDPDSNDCSVVLLFEVIAEYDDWPNNPPPLISLRGIIEPESCWILDSTFATLILNSEPTLEIVPEFSDCLDPADFTLGNEIVAKMTFEVAVGEDALFYPNTTWLHIESTPIVELIVEFGTQRPVAP